MKQAYGGVLINQLGQVLLRKPSDQYHGQAWTFAKGKPEPGELPEETALREVYEETGVIGKIIKRIPGSFDGSKTTNEYYLMFPIEDTRIFHSETESITWVTKEEALQLISLTTKPKRRARDLRLLDAAFALFLSLQEITL